MNNRTMILAAVLVIVLIAYFYMAPETQVVQPEPATTSEPAETTAPGTDTQ